MCLKCRGRLRFIVSIRPIFIKNGGSMLAILNSLNAHNFQIFQPIFMKLVSKSMVYKALLYKIYLILGLRSPLNAVTNVRDRVPVPNIGSKFFRHYFCI